MKHRILVIVCLLLQQTIFASEKTTSTSNLEDFDQLYLELNKYQNVVICFDSNPNTGIPKDFIWLKRNSKDTLEKLMAKRVAHLNKISKVPSYTSYIYCYSGKYSNRVIWAVTDKFRITDKTLSLSGFKDYWLKLEGGRKKE